MSNEEQNRAIAEVTGLTEVPTLTQSFTSSLDWMHEAEKTLRTATHACEYEDQLKAIVKRDNHRPTDIHIWMWYATAAQRAEAFLRCKGLWKD